MSTESYLRSVLTEAAEGVVTAPVDTESALEGSLHDGGRRIKIRRFGAVIAIAAAFAAGALIGPKVFEFADDDPPVKPAVSPSPTSTSQTSGSDLPLYGRYEATIDGGANLRFAQGRWTIAFLRNDRFEVGYPKGEGGPEGSGPAPYFSATEDRVNIPSAGLNCTDPGEYEWNVLANGDLRLQVLDDPCAHRVRVLTGRPWHPISNEG